MNGVLLLGLKIVAALVMVGVLVVVHELGHYLFARLFKVGTPVFSIGMGPRIFGFRAFETDFRISALPIGGYVRMSGADPFGEEDAEDWCPPEQNFIRKPVWQRLIIMLAGPGMNLALPLVLFTVAFMLGRPVLTTMIGTVIPGSTADEAGLRVGDQITSVNGAATPLLVDAEEALRAQAGRPVTLGVQRGEELVEVILPAEAVSLGLDGRVDLEALGALQQRRMPVVAVVDPGSPAARSGLHTFDYVASVDGEPVQTWDELSAALTAGVAHEVERVRIVTVPADDGTVQKQVDRATITLQPAASWANPSWATWANPWGLEFPATYVGAVEPDSAAFGGVRPGDRIVGIDHDPVVVWRDVLVKVGRTWDGESVRPLTLHVIRDGQPVGITLAPRLTTDLRGATVVKRPIMGVRQDSALYDQGDTATKFYGLGEAAVAAVDLTIEQVGEMLKMLGNIFSGQIGFTRVVGGPVSIVYQAGAAAEGGFFVYVTTMALLSLSLGVINLLPVPLLDGGQIVFYAIEGVRGRPVPPAIRDQIQMVGALALAALFIVVTISDFSKLFTG